MEDEDAEDPFYEEEVEVQEDHTVGCMRPYPHICRRPWPRHIFLGDLRQRISRRRRHPHRIFTTTPTTLPRHRRITIRRLFLHR